MRSVFVRKIHLSALLLGALLALPALAVPVCSSGDFPNGFTGSDSDEMVVTFTTPPGLGAGDLSSVSFTFVPLPAGPLSWSIKLDGGAFLPIAEGDTSVAGNTVNKAGSFLTITHAEDPTPATKTWRVRVAGLGTSAITGTASSHAAFTRVHLGPKVFGAGCDRTIEEGSVPSTVLPAVGCGSAATVCGAGPAPALTYAWMQPAGTPPIAFAPASNPTITIDPLPSVSLDTTYTFELQVTDTSAEDGVLARTEPINLVVQSRAGRDVMLVLDHSGSMTSENKWEVARRAANLFVDLFRKLRNNDSEVEDAADRSRVGVLKFESTSCSEGPLTPMGVNDLRVADLCAAGHKVCRFPDLPAVVQVGGSFPAAPWGCTPIGDGLQLAVDRLNLVPTSAGRPAVVLMTDGIENSGASTIDEFRANLAASGSDVKNAPFHTLAVGQTQVEEAKLQALALPHGGTYRKVSSLSDQALQEFFVLILGDILKAQEIVPEAGGTPSQKSFVLNSGEGRVAFILAWNNAGSGPYYPRLALAGSLWAPSISFNAAGGGSFTNVRKSETPSPANEGYAFLVVDRAVGKPLDGTWTVSFADATGTVVVPPAGANARVFAIVDPHLWADFAVDRKVHQTGEPILLSADIREGGRPVLGADVRVALDKPEEGVGTFLVQNFALLPWNPQLPGGPVTTRPPVSGPTGGVPTAVGDVLPPKQARLAALFDALGLDFLPVGDDSLVLFDDGAHGDGAAGDGRYANSFTATAKEGTYDFRFAAHGTANSGTPFSRSTVLSAFVRVDVDPLASPTAVVALPPLGDNLLTSQVFLTPKDRGGQFLGPFHTAEVSFTALSGQLLGGVVDHGDGRYSQTVAWPAGQTPLVVPAVQGKPFPPVLAAPGGPGRGELVFTLAGTAWEDDLRIDDATTFGVRLGFALNDRLSLGGDFGVTPTRDTAGDGGTAFHLLATLEADLWASPAQRFFPYVAVGAGQVRFEDFLVQDRATAYSLGLGLKLRFAPRVTGRFELRDLRLGSNALAGGATDNWQLSWGVGLGF